MKNDVHWTKLVRVPEKYIDMEPSLLHDMLCAIRSIEHIDDKLFLDDFDYKYLGELDVLDFYEYDNGLSRWLELSSLSTMNDLIKFRGYGWMTKTAPWLKNGIPPVVIISYNDVQQVGDGRGRINFANMVNLKVPSYLLRFREC